MAAAPGSEAVRAKVRSRVGNVNGAGVSCARSKSRRWRAAAAHDNNRD